MRLEDLPFKYKNDITARTINSFLNNSGVNPLLKIKSWSDPFSSLGMSRESKYGKLISDSFLKSLKNIYKIPGMRRSLFALPAVVPMSYMRNMNKYKSMLTDMLSKAAAYYVEEIDCDSSLSKKASNSRQVVTDIMDKIYKEDPSYWPYGLSIAGHNSVYLIKDASTNDPVGFVGWQEIKRSGKKVGSYSIGILPEYRNRGFAKEAVAKIIREKADGVDEVRSYICPHNYRSKGLANSLHVKIQEKF